MAAQCCPKCKGTSGYQFEMTSTVVMIAYGWTAEDEPEAGGDAWRACDGVSTFECMDCGHKLREKTARKIRGLED